MQPTTSRHSLLVARQRLSAAEQILAQLNLTTEAQSIGGYAVECSLKALILEKTPEVKKSEVLQKLTQGSKSHGKEFLLDRLRELDVIPSSKLAKRFRRLKWTTNLRYEIGRRDTGETKGLLKTAKEVIEWTASQIR